jgi:hypothetical protein
MAAKTNYFGTFLDTLNMPAPGQGGGQAPQAPTLDSLIKVWPGKEPMTVVDVAGALNLNLDTAADVLLKAQAAGLAVNKAGKFTLTPTGFDALKKAKAL